MMCREHIEDSKILATDSVIILSCTIIIIIDERQTPWESQMVYPTNGIIFVPCCTCCFAEIGPPTKMVRGPFSANFKIFADFSPPCRNQSPPFQHYYLRSIIDLALFQVSSHIRFLLTLVTYIYLSNHNYSNCNVRIAYQKKNKRKTLRINKYRQSFEKVFSYSIFSLFTYFRNTRCLTQLNGSKRVRIICQLQVVQLLSWGRKQKRRKVPA